jgi:hypothetical protein
MRILILVFKTLSVMCACFLALSIFGLLNSSGSGYLGEGGVFLMFFLFFIFTLVIIGITMMLNKTQENKEKEIKIINQNVLPQKSNLIMVVSVVAITILVVFELIMFLSFRN